MSFIAAVDICNAADLRYSARMGVVNESNPNHLYLVENNELSRSLYGQVSYIQNGYEVDMRLIGSMDMINYQNNSIADLANAELNTDVIWIVSPSQFELYLGDIFMQTTIDSTSTLTTSNQQNVNAASLGPNYTFHFDNRSSLLLQGRVNDYYYEYLDANNNRYIGVSRFEYDISSTVSAVAGYEYTVVAYDNNISNIDYVRNDVSVSVNHHKYFYELDLLVGATDINRDRASDLYEPNIILSITNKRSWTTDIRIAYLNDLSDTSNDIFSINTNISQNGNVFLSSNSSLYKRNAFAFDITKAVSTGQVLVTWRGISADYYDNNDLDQEISRITFTYEFNTSPMARLTTSITRQDTEYTNRLIPRDDADLLISVNYAYSVSRHVNLNASVDLDSRDSTSTLDNYDNNAIMLSIEYRSN
jgi:hypothetical protein